MPSFGAGPEISGGLSSATRRGRVRVAPYPTPRCDRGVPVSVARRSDAVTPASCGTPARRPGLLKDCGKLEAVYCWRRRGRGAPRRGGITGMGRCGESVIMHETRPMPYGLTKGWIWQGDRGARKDAAHQSGYVGPVLEAMRGVPGDPSSPGTPRSAANLGGYFAGLGKPVAPGSPREQFEPGASCRQDRRARSARGRASRVKPADAAGPNGRAQAPNRRRRRRAVPPPLRQKTVAGTRGGPAHSTRARRRQALLRPRSPLPMVSRGARVPSRTKRSPRSEQALRAVKWIARSGRSGQI